MLLARPVAAQEPDPFDRLQRTQQQFEQFSDSQSEQYYRLRDRLDRQNQLLTEHARAMWGRYQESTPVLWVSYADDARAVAATDFDKGEITLEAVVDSSLPLAEREQQARLLIRGRLHDILATEVGEVVVLENQVIAPGGAGEILTPDNAGELFDRSMAGQVKPVAPITGDDRARRDHYQLRLHLVPDHLRVRLQRFLPYVVQHARTWNIKPSYLLAFMHQESMFNPLAVGDVRFGGKILHAQGLMQLVPEFAGREINRRVLNEDVPPAVDTLRDPSRNIWYGAAYLSYMRDERFLSRADNDRDKSMWLSVVAYNAGANFVLRNVLPRVNPQGSREDFYLQLQRAAEPNDYLEKITKLQQQYVEFDRVE